MQANFTVNSAVAEPIEVEVDIDGQKVPAKVSGIVLELVALDGSTSPTFRYRPADISEELAKFPAGQTVVVTVEPVA